ncbi:FAD-binding oxidoreductase [Yinghuangia seranimata]|uniref:FAD-binding oxidoreductase n=1 Tax=Yinghuangia seranimata TaxID=408067 RepID=UPI00248BD0F8|nr:FAD-linked oxidase C-terminal domain-containing protein [Yinghuangia seranimata]MDI2131389.1 FAD-linked oxidase C-terminal domain-containing protein [Yinghuangia seranimata]
MSEAGAPTAEHDAARADRVVAELRAVLPARTVVADPDVAAAYAHDMAALCAAGRPAAVVLAEDVDQVRDVMRVATRLRVPVVPQGARTGLSGAANAIDGCIVLSLTRMDRILEINPVDRVAVVEPGVVNADLSKAAAEFGLAYPPDPSSWETCTIGGNIGTGAGGLCCVKYGVTAEYVLGLDVVLADGELLRTGRRTAKGVAGYDLTRLFVGAEGTLGVVVRATLALRPAPLPALVLAAQFGSTAAVGRAVASIIEAGHVPSLMELMDATTVRAVNDMAKMGLPEETAALLLVALDTPDPRAELAAIGELCAAAGAFEVLAAEDSEQSAMFLTARRLALPALERLGTCMIDDVAVPRSRLADMLDGVAEISTAYDTAVGVCAHAGDGNTHPIVIFDAADAGATERARAAFEAIMALGLELGGTITGEHGVGTLKRDMLARELGDIGLRTHRAVKAALDPLNILNPGKVFEPGR